MNYPVRLVPAVNLFPEFWDVEIVACPLSLRQKLHKLGYFDKVPSVGEANEILNSHSASEPDIRVSVSYKDVMVDDRGSVRTVSATKSCVWALSNGDTVSGECLFSSSLEGERVAGCDVDRALAGDC